MNELEKYRQAWVGQTFMAIQNNTLDNQNKALENLFDAAIALDLPVKFHKWKKDIKGYKSYVITNGINHFYEAMIDTFNYPKGDDWTDQQYYQYWLDNVFKIE